MPYDTLHIYYLEGRVAPRLLPVSPDFIGNWEEDGFSFLFFRLPADGAIHELIAAQPELILLDQFRMTYEEWLGEKFQPFRAGCFWIAPPWRNDTLPPSPDLVPIVLDPGVVFGTGTHPTTHDCLEAIGTLCRFRKIKTATDLGTGTGLLAIAACKMGCERVLALDFNFLAAKTAHRNVRLNNMEDRIAVVQGRAEEYIDRPSDLMISNIHYDVMRELIGSELFLGHRWFVLSGLMRSQAKAVEEQLRRLPVSIISVMQKDGAWHTFLGRSNVSV